MLHVVCARLSFGLLLGRLSFFWLRLAAFWSSLPHVVYGHLGLGNASVSGVAAARAPCYTCSPQLSGLAF